MALDDIVKVEVTEFVYLVVTRVGRTVGVRGVDDFSVQWLSLVPWEVRERLALAWERAANEFRGGDELDTALVIATEDVLRDVFPRVVFSMRSGQ